MTNMACVHDYCMRAREDDGDNRCRFLSWREHRLSGGEDLFQGSSQPSSSFSTSPFQECEPESSGVLPRPRTFIHGDYRTPEQEEFSGMAAGLCLFIGIPVVIGLALLLAQIQ